MNRAYTVDDVDGSLPLAHNSCLQVGDQRNPPSPDVSRRLPAELLASVFVRIAHNFYYDEEWSHSTPTSPSWVNVSYVCRYWRSVALKFPTLWSYIPATSRHWTEELLARSQMVPLKISMKVATRSYDCFHPRPELKAQVLSIVEQVINHSQRIQKLHIDVATFGQEIGDQILANFFFTRLPWLQYLDISCFNLSEGKSWLHFAENTPALHTLRLSKCSMPWYALGPSVLTTLHLSSVGIPIPKNTMAEFLAMLRRLPRLVQLSVDSTLPSAHAFLSNGEFDATPTISLPHLSNLSIKRLPVSVAITFILRRHPTKDKSRTGSRDGIPIRLCVHP